MPNEKKTTEENQTPKETTGSDTVERRVMCECCFCHEPFEAWEDEFGDINDDACRECDMSYQEGMENDRDNFGANG